MQDPFARYLLFLPYSSHPLILLTSSSKISRYSIHFIFAILLFTDILSHTFRFLFHVERRMRRRLRLRIPGRRDKRESRWRNAKGMYIYVYRLDWIRGTTENNELVTARKTKPNIKHDLSVGRDFYRYSLKVTVTTLDLDLSVGGRWEVGVHACTIFTRIRKYRAFEWFESTVNFSFDAGFRGFGSLSLYRALTREIFKTSSRTVSSFHVLSCACWG